MIAFHPIYIHPLPEDHRFPMIKYELLYEQLLRENVVEKSDFFKPGIIDEEYILISHSEAYWQKLKSLSLTRLEERRTGFPLSEALLLRERTIAQGTLDSALWALENGYGDERVFTFSMHGLNNFPFKKEKSSLDIGLEDGIGDAEYLKILDRTLPKLFETVNPQFVFYLSGVDVLSTDKMGKLKLTLDGCRRRDELVYSLCKQGIVIRLRWG